MATHILVGTRKGAWIYTSDERREQWEVSEPILPGWTINHMSVDLRRETPRIYAAASHWAWGPSVARSDDSGKTWEQRSPGLGFPEDMGLAIAYTWHVEPGHADEPGVVYCGTQPAGLFRSEDWGESWAPVEAINRHRLRELWGPTGSVGESSFGAGDGLVTRTIAGKFEIPGSSITGIDLNGYAGDGIATYEGRTLPYESGVFDLTIAVCSLHHTESPRHYLTELHRVTKVGGHLVLIETLADSLDIHFGADIGVILDYVACWCLGKRQINIPGKYRGYHEWPQMLRDTGFEPIETLAHTGHQNPDDLGVDQPLIQIPHGIIITERRPDPVAS